jgi:hypothetical protein
MVAGNKDDLMVLSNPMNRDAEKCISGRSRPPVGNGGSPRPAATSRSGGPMGKELFYGTLQDPARIMAVDIAAGNGAIRAGIPHPLFEARLHVGPARNRFVVTRDGNRFLAIVPSEQKPVNSFTMIVNWPSLLKKQ